MGMEVAEKIGFGLIAVGTGGERNPRTHQMIDCVTSPT